MRGLRTAPTSAARSRRRNHREIIRPPDHAAPRDAGGITDDSARRSVNVNVAPVSALLYAAITPPWPSTMLRTIVSPIPIPFDLVVTNGANNVPLTCAG